MKKILIMAGGTGGHIFPALTIADHCYAQGVAIYWLGSAGGMEERLVVPQYRLSTIKVSGLRGKKKSSLLFAPWHLLRAIWQAVKILRQVKPDVVLGMGGFVSGPGGVAAWLLRIPLVVHEQNSIAGLTNRWLARLASESLQAFPGAFSKSVAAKVVGNPVRQDIAAIPNPKERFAYRRGPSRVLILGGSRGAHAINELMCEIFKGWPKEPLPLIWHQTGSADLESILQQYQKISPTAVVEAFITDMAAAYEWADVVVARAGALTVSELATTGAASLLIPYPYAVDDHQFYNAKWLEKVGATVIFRQEELSAERCRNTLFDLCADRQKIVAMAESAHRVGPFAAGAKIIAACENVVRKRQGKHYAPAD